MIICNLNFQLSYDKVFNNVHHVSGTFVTEWYEASGTGVTGGREIIPALFNRPVLGC